MNNSSKTKQDVIEENVVLRRRIRELEKSEEALRNSQRRFRSLVEATSDWIWEMDSDERYTYVSPKVKEMLGYEPKEVVGMRPFDFMPADEAERVRALFRDISQSRRPFSDLQNANLHKDGTEVVLETSGVPIIDSQGNFLGYRGIDRDITDRRRAEEKLKRARHKYRTLFENAILGILRTTPDGRILSANPYVARMHGYSSPEEMMEAVADTRALYVDPRARGRLMEILEHQGSAEGFETELYKKDGSTMWASMTPWVVRDSKGRILYIEGTLQDITGRKKAEKALRTSETKFRSFIEQSPVAIFVADKEGQLVQVNRSALELLGCDAETLLRLRVWELHPVGDRTEILRDFALLNRDGRIDVERRLQKQDGSIVWVSLHVSLIEGGLSLAYCSDITSGRQTEETLRRYEMLSGNMRDIILFVKADNGEILEANTTAEKSYGYSREEILNLTIKDLRAEGTVGPLTFQLAEADAHGILFKTIHKRKDGSIFPVEVSSRGATINDTRTLISIVRDIGERDQAEEALRWKTALLEAQLNASIDGILVVDENRKRIITNHRLIDLWDIPQDILEDEDDGTLLKYVVGLAKYPEEFLKRVTRLYDHPYETSRDEIEFKNGMVLDRHSAPVLDEKGHLYGRIWTFRDITERKRAEEGLRESEERFRTLIEGAPEAIFVQADGRFIYVNPAMVKLLGASTPDDLLGKVQFTWMAPEYHEATRARMRLQLETGEAVPPAERIYLRFDGSPIPVESAAVPVKFEGKIAHLVFLRDITERKKAEEELRQSEEMYRTLVAASPDSITVTDLSGRITLASRKALELFGVPSEQHAIGRTILEWVPPEGRIEAGAALRRLLTTGVTQPTELVLRREDGTFFNAEIHGAPIRSADGIIRGAILIARDVTERNNLQAQLLQSQKMEAIGTLAGGVAHDFNNILTAIMGYASLLQAMMPEDHPFRSYAQEISNCTNKAANVTRSLLAFSRKQTMQLQPESLNTILRDLEKLLRRLVPEDVTFTTSLHEDAVVTVDITQIDQVLINLVSNAKDAMPKGGALFLETDTAQLSKEFKQVHGFGAPGRYAMISVTDTGVGMDEATQKKIFEPFFTTKEVGKGTGLGLSIVYGIIKQHNGYVTVSSELGRGARFDVYLPTVAIEASQSQQTPISSQRGTETILLAEDDAHVRRTVKEILRMAGYTIIEAVDGEDAIRQYRANATKIDLLILDVVMPGKNGKDAFEEIRNTNPSIPALFMSGYTGDIVLDKGVQDLSVNYISKPISANDLLKKIQEVLENRCQLGAGR
jgi:two-component system, cell cycle sensor histidine kinase and response regulator CckA